jgi:hypothetical protein
MKEGLEMSSDILMYLIIGAFIVEAYDNLVLRYKIRKIEEDIWVLKCGCREMESKLGGNENEK